MAEDTLDKEHEATGKRLEDLRGKGKSMRSRDLTSGLVFSVVITTLIFMAPYIKKQFSDNFVYSFNYISVAASDVDFPTDYMHKILWENFMLLLPLFAIAIASVLLSPFIFGGWNFTLQVLEFNFSKLNPIDNLKNMFSLKIFKNIFTSVFKVVVIIGVLVVFILNKKHQISELMGLPFHSMAAISYSIIKEFIIVISSALVLIILFDIIYTFFDYRKNAKMSMQEIKDEQKDTEGNTEVKKKVRSKQYQLLKQRLNIMVPRANVIITNPTHYAIAIQYDHNKDNAPKVIAKGKGVLAQQIRHLAVINGIPIYEAPFLARALYHAVNLNAEIISELYMGVAIVLSYVQQLKNYQQGIGQPPAYVEDMQVPEELIYPE